MARSTRTPRSGPSDGAPEHGAGSTGAGSTEATGGLVPEGKHPDTLWGRSLTRIESLGDLLFYVLLDTVFLTLWAGCARLVQAATDRLGEATGMDGLVLRAAQAMFAVSTLVVVGTYVVKDMIAMVRYIWSRRD